MQCKNPLCTEIGISQPGKFHSPPAFLCFLLFSFDGDNSIVSQREHIVAYSLAFYTNKIHELGIELAINPHTLEFFSLFLPFSIKFHLFSLFHFS